MQRSRSRSRKIDVDRVQGGPVVGGNLQSGSGGLRARGVSGLVWDIGVPPGGKGAAGRG